MNAWQWALTITVGLAAYIALACRVGAWVGRVAQVRTQMARDDEPAQAVDCE